MHNYCINKLINIEGVIVKNIIHADSFVKIFIETAPTPHICPCCNNKTSRIHDYRLQIIKDLPLQTNHCYEEVQEKYPNQYTIFLYK